MWTLENIQLPIVASPNNLAPIAYLKTGDSLAPLAQIDFQANYTLPGLQVTAAPTIVNAITTGNTVNIGSLVQVDAIAIGTSIYVPAIDPANPRPGEFTLSGQSATLTPLAPIRPGLPVQILGGVETTPTDYVDPSILQIFYGLPVVAEVKWSLSAENHPSGSINLRVIGDDDCALVDARFKKGTELSFARIGFLVNSYTKKLINTHDAPGRYWEVSISLGGKWEAKKYQRPVFLLPSANPPIPDGRAYNDPACQLFATYQALRKARPLRISVSELAARSGVNFVGFSSASTRDQILAKAGIKPLRSVFFNLTPYLVAPVPPLDVWSVAIAKDSPRGATGQWQQTADELKRHNGCYLDYTRPDAVYARDIESGDRWSYTVPEISIALKGDTTYSPGVEGYAVEYPATKLSGEFTEPPNTNAASSGASGNWKRRDPIVKVLRSGNINADTPPASFVTIRNMGMNFDGSGPTQEAISVVTVDGVEMHKTRTVYGAAFLSTQVTEDLNAGLPIGTGGLKHGPVIGNAASFWGIVQQETTETLYDYTTRYVTGSKMTGFKVGRYKQESDGLEVLGLVGATDSQSQEERALYEFKTIPTYAVEQKVLEQFAQHYGDAQLTPIPSEMVKRCNPDGSSSMVSIKDPNFVEPMAVMATLSYTNSFAHTRNPDTTPDEPLPDLTQGEERLSESAIRILDSDSTRVRTNDKNYKFKTNEDQFISYEYETGSQGAQFGEYVGKRTFSSSSGRPGAAQKLPDIYEKEEPEAISGNPNIYKLPQEANFDYVLCTPGYTPNDPSTSSIGFPKAIYLAQGIVGAETDLKYKDIQESVEFSATIPTNHQIRPLDYVNLNDGGTTHKTRVISVENTILIQGVLDGYPLLVAPRNTVLKAGIDRTIPFTITRRRLSGGGTILNSRIFGLTIGEIVPPTLQGRGNY